MLDILFQTTRSLLVRAGGSAEIGVLTRELGCRSVFLVTDPGIYRTGLVASAIGALQAEGLAVTLFSEVEADPSERLVENAIRLAIAAGADAVVGFGGGSSMDVAKLVALLAASPVALADIYGVGLARGPRLKLILVPTTAGTGSEVTPISIVTTGSGEKKGIVSSLLLPDWAVLDADLTLGLPPSVTAATGIDAMVHAIEAYTSRRLKNPISDALAKEALSLLSRNIRIVCREGGARAARESMLLGATLAGMAFANAPVAAVHALAYPIGARFHVPHGLSNAMVLPGVIDFNASHAGELYSDLAEIVFPDSVQTGDGGAAILADGFRALSSEIGLDLRLSTVGIRREDLPGLAEDAMKQTRLLVNNPRELTYHDALAIYEGAL